MSDAGDETAPSAWPRRWLSAAAVLLTAILLCAAVFVVWAANPLGPGPDALDALRSDGVVRVTESPEGYVFAPAASSTDPTTAIVLYPGGRVDVRSYARLCRLVAARGRLVVLAPMPLSLAVLAPQRADEAMAAHPGVRNWVVGGHSLGGAMAAQYAADRIGRVKGLVLLAAYPPASVDLRSAPAVVCSAYGGADGLVDVAAVAASRERLPEGTLWTVIAGGNHAQFGDYGPQPGDGEATIGARDQQEQAAAAIESVLLDAAAGTR